MNDSTREISPLRQRMLEDMRLRKLAPGTQTGYVRAVRKLAGYLRRPPDTATVEDLRNFQLHLVDQGASPITLNATITGLKFFFDVTLDRSELMAKMKPVFVPRTLPVVLSREEVGSLIAATKNLKHQTALSVAYGAGLRASEVISLKVGDVDSTRMTLRIQQGKGGKDRYAMLSPVMLERLRTWWRVARAQGKMLDGGWLFPGLNPVEPLTARQLNRAVHEARLAARIIDKQVSLRSMNRAHRAPRLLPHAAPIGRATRRKVSDASKDLAGQYPNRYPIAPDGTDERSNWLAESGIIGCNRVCNQICQHHYHEGAQAHIGSRTRQTHRGNR